jgi:lysozyme
MKTNQTGIDLIKQFEGVALTAYKCPAGVWTIAYGHTGDVHPGQTITKEEAEALLRKDLDKFEKGISACLGGAASTDDQFAAMVSLAYNIGLGAFKSSSVLRYHREGNLQKAAQSFLLWNKAGGKVLAGLQRRRKAESELYLT